MSRRQQGEFDPGCAVGGLVLLLLGLALLYPFRQAGKQSLDAWTRSAWIIQNWKDEGAFPAKAELCATPFCTRVDTQPKYVGGNPGHRSETKLPFCPDHTSALPRTGSQFDDLVRCIYWVLSMILSALEATLALAIPALPLCLGVCFLLRGKQEGGIWSNGLSYALGFGMLLGVPATLGAWFMFAWW